jgi:hypothetical protein
MDGSRRGCFDKTLPALSSFITNAEPIAPLAFGVGFASFSCRTSRSVAFTIASPANTSLDVIIVGIKQRSRWASKQAR